MGKTAAHRGAQVIAAAFGTGAAVVVGQLTAIDEHGVAWVDFSGNALGPLAARWVGPVDAAQVEVGMAVALAFDLGDRAAPLILGCVSDRLPAAAPSPLAAAQRNRGTRAPQQLEVDGETVHVHAERSLSLSCGRASIVLREDGKVIIKGGEIVSRASGTHKIKGGLVNIN